MIAAVLILLACAARCFPDTAFGRFVTQWLSIPVAGWLIQADRRQVIFLLLLVAAIIFAGEALAALGPIDAGLVLLWDVASYLDAVVATLTVASLTRSKDLGWRLRMLVSRRPTPAKQRRRRSRRVARGRCADNDDEEGPAARAA